MGGGCCRAGCGGSHRPFPAETWQILKDKKIIPGSFCGWENPWEGFEHYSSCRSRMAAHCSLGKVWGPQHPPCLSPCPTPLSRGAPQASGPTPHTRMGLKHGRLIKSPFKRTTIHRTTTRGVGRVAAAQGRGSTGHGGRICAVMGSVSHPARDRDRVGPMPPPLTSTSLPLPPALPIPA